MPSDNEKLPEPILEEEEPFYNSLDSSMDTDTLEKVNDGKHRRAMQMLEFNSIFKLLGWCIFLAFLVYLGEIIFFKKDSFGSSFFDLLKTIIIAAVGYLLGQKPKSGN